MSQRTTCPECDLRVGVAESEDGGPVEVDYCPRCGQRVKVPALRVTEILHEALASLFSLEVPILRTARDLLCGPGHVARAWILGKRRSYINPLKFVVVVGVIVALVYEPLMKLYAAVTPEGQAVVEVGLSHYATGYFAFVCIALLVPIACALLALGPLFRVRASWLEWYVLGLYTYGLAAALQLVIQFTIAQVPPGSARSWLLLLKGLLPLALLAWGGFQFAGRAQRWNSFALCIAAQLLFVGIIGAIAAVLGSG